MPTDNHELRTPSQGETDWHVPLNENTERVDTLLEIRDTEASKTRYEAKDGAMFRATDTGAIFRGDGSNWVPLEVAASAVRTDRFHTADRSFDVLLRNDDGTVRAVGAEDDLVSDTDGGAVLQWLFDNRDTIHIHVPAGSIPMRTEPTVPPGKTFTITGGGKEVSVLDQQADGCDVINAQTNTGYASLTVKDLHLAASSTSRAGAINGRLKDSHIARCKLDNPLTVRGEDGTAFAGRNVVIRDCHFTGAGGSYDVGVHAQCFGCRVIDNVFEAPGSDKMNICNVGNPYDDVVFRGNRFVGGFNNVLTVYLNQDSVFETKRMGSVSFVDNFVDQSIGNKVQFGLFKATCDAAANYKTIEQVEIKNNTIRTDVLGSAEGYEFLNLQIPGIEVADRLLITGNDVDAASKTNFATVYAIGSTLNYAEISDNRIAAEDAHRVFELVSSGGVDPTVKLGKVERNRFENGANEINYVKAGPAASGTVLASGNTSPSGTVRNFTGGTKFERYSPDI